MAEEIFLFTSESVNEGHPDKLCDAVSDAVLDACLAQDPESKVACETATKTGMVMVFGEITTKAKIDYEAVVRKTIQGIGYDAAEKGLDYKTCNVIVAIEEQSPDIADKVHVGKDIEDLGAGDQGIVFGYATDETEELMPMTHILAQKLAKKLADARKDGTCGWMRPDGKTQVTMEYKQVGGRLTPIRVDSIVISTQHDPDVTQEFIIEELHKHVIAPIVPADLLDDNTKYFLNRNGRFVIGGPHGDAGLTGRKIIVDTYGGWGAHGGGAFSGKDPTKVDRSAAYAARWAAKSLVAADLVKRCLIQLSYTIGIAEPNSVHIETYGTESVSKAKLYKIIKENFDFRPGFILRDLKLKRPVYGQSAAYGHFGRNLPGFTWEEPKELVISEQ
eukprot:TRINITY_DN777893_c0_g1_i1.p1 TRINITY_DN777893_c0_g1~~TRINITY_DN777893_c0_g1_i1.p1  ORF type:complete len:413 (-),score=113.69 TRINITY_DN777893_c0_g1_i1:160-1326(-)